MGVQNVAAAPPTITAARTAVTLTARRRHGVAINAVAEFLRKSLDVPEIYLEPKLGMRIDILAVNAAGSGDFHGVEITAQSNSLSSTTTLAAYIRQLRSLPLHFKWLALPDTQSVRKISANPVLFDESGLGRIGILLLAENGAELPTVTVLAHAQRFKVAYEDLAQTERYVQRHKPDIEVRF